MNNSNYLECNSCGKTYRITADSDTDFCEDCSTDNDPYDKDYESDVILLTNPCGKTAPVFVD